MAADLLPCPFCGEAVKRDIVRYINTGNPHSVRFACDNCDFVREFSLTCWSGPWEQAWREHEAAADAAWNRRAPPLAAPATTTLSLQEARTLVRAQADEAERRRTEAFIAANSTPPAAPAAVTEAIQRADQYLQAGGLFNPEMMEHEKVRDLIVAMRAALAAAASAERGE